MDGIGLPINIQNVGDCEGQNRCDEDLRPDDYREPNSGK